MKYSEKTCEEKDREIERLKAENEWLKSKSAKYQSMALENFDSIDRLTASLAKAHEALKLIQENPGVVLIPKHGNPEYASVKISENILSDPDGKKALERWKGLEAECARLREALEKALNGCEHKITPWSCGLCDDTFRPLITHPQEPKEDDGYETDCVHGCTQNCPEGCHEQPQEPKEGE